MIAGSPARTPPLDFGSERALAAVWLAGLAAHALTATDGTPVTVVAPGIPGGGPGPDFRHAVLVLGGELRFGDVEVHLRSSGWFAHGHRRDPAYNDVVLHVVASDDTGTPVIRANGLPVTTVILPF